MPPSNSIANSPNRLLGYFKSICNLLHRYSLLSQFTNQRYIIFSKLRSGATLSAGCSVLSNSVAHIVLSRSEKQMLRINTIWSVALMAHQSAIWNRASSKVKGQPMSTKVFSKHSKNAVAFLNCSTPKPTTFLSLNNPTPKAHLVNCSWFDSFNGARSLLRHWLPFYSRLTMVRRAQWHPPFVRRLSFIPKGSSHAQ